MDKIGFKSWLVKSNSYSSQKQIYDCLSRASRVEKELARGIENFTYEKAFAMDNCKDVLFMISHMGKNIPFQTTLPIGNRQIAPIMAAARKYILYLQFTHEKIRGCCTYQQRVAAPFSLQKNVAKDLKI